MKRLQNWLAEVLGIRIHEELELTERVRHVRSTNAIIIGAGVLFSVFNLGVPGMEWLGVAEFASIVLFFIPATLLTWKTHHIWLAETLTIVGALWISNALILFGGIEGTGLNWVYSVPFLIFFIKGQRLGWLYSAAAFSITVLSVCVIGPAAEFTYKFSPVVRVQFLLSLFFYWLVAGAFNHVRTRFEAELRQRRNEAEAASQAKSRFLAAASHDLRQPAHALGMFVARLSHMPTTESTKALISGVDASVQALQEMLDAFFDYSRLDSQLTQARARPFAVDEVLDKLRTSFTHTAQAKGLRLLVNPCRQWIYSDPVLLHRVLLNLVSNAVQHTHQGTVLVTCRPSAHSHLRIQVRDSGVGIAKVHQSKIFEEFYQIENPERDRNKGLGLGLSIVQRSCQLLGHPITLRSDVGCGTCITVTVPTALPQDPTPMPALSTPGATTELQGMKILLVEDDVLGSVALQELLQAWGCAVFVAGTAAGALRIWTESAPFDFILTDYRLPGSHNGIAIVRQLRNLAQAEVPACIISGDTDAAVRQEAQNAGLLLLQKPVKPAKIRSVLRRINGDISTARLGKG